eukprot:scaffold49019_cov22-Tisochrysis_lutea.AAC.1
MMNHRVRNVQTAAVADALDKLFPPISSHSHNRGSGPAYTKKVMEEEGQYILQASVGWGPMLLSPHHLPVSTGLGGRLFSLHSWAMADCSLELEISYLLCVHPHV